MQNSTKVLTDFYYFLTKKITIMLLFINISLAGTVDVNNYLLNTGPIFSIIELQEAGVNLNRKIVFVLLFLSIIYILPGDETYYPKAMVSPIAVQVSLWTDEEVTLSFQVIYTRRMKLFFAPDIVKERITKQMKKELKNLLRPLSLKEFLEVNRENITDKVLNNIVSPLEKEGIRLSQMMMTEVTYSEDVVKKLSKIAELEQQLQVIPIEQEMLTNKMEMVSAKLDMLRQMPPSDTLDNDILEQERLLEDLEQKHTDWDDAYDDTREELSDLRYELGL